MSGEECFIVAEILLMTKYPRLCYRHFFNLVSYSMLSMVTSENTKNIRSRKVNGKI